MRRWSRRAVLAGGVAATAGLAGCPLRDQPERAVLLELFNERERAQTVDLLVQGGGEVLFWDSFDLGPGVDQRIVAPDLPPTESTVTIRARVGRQHDAATLDEAEYVWTTVRDELDVYVEVWARQTADGEDTVVVTT